MIILTNKTALSVDITDAGKSFDPEETYIIPPQDYPLWAASSDAVASILDSKIVVNDGDGDLNRRVGIALLQNNVAILNEYYTLTDEEGPLMGNGYILQINDGLNTTENVVDIDDESEQDDDPTNS